MSKINLNNYEAFMLDYLEGNLSPQDTEALKAFALLHPELDLEFESDENQLVTLEQEAFLFENKQNLKAKFSDDLVIGFLENVLEGKEKQLAQTLAANNTIFKHELQLYKRTIAFADTSIVYEHKQKLKRHGATVLLLQNNYVRVAASLILLAGIWFMVSLIFKDEVTISSYVANAVKENTPINTNSVIIKVNTNEKEIIASKEEKSLIAKNTNAIIKEKREINTSTDSIVGQDKKDEEPQLADNFNKNEHSTTITDTNSIVNNTVLEKLLPKFIIEEGADDEPVVTKEKSKVWKLASDLLKRLNRKGVENVNSSEDNNEMFIGALTISKPN